MVKEEEEIEEDWVYGLGRRGRMMKTSEGRQRVKFERYRGHSTITKS